MTAEISAHRPRSTARVDGLDLVRGAAIALVLLRHSWPDAFQGAGVVGVVMFFALSGYLISGLLLRELRATGAVSLRRFYARRARRLFPALLAMVAGFALVTIVLDPLGDRDELGRTVAVALTYTADLPFHHGSAAIFHLWTLALEEQFYLVWPLWLAFTYLRGRLLVGIVSAAALTLASCIAGLVWLAPDYDLAYALPTSWAVCFVIGAAARVVADRIDDEHARSDAGPAWTPSPAAVAAAIAALGVLSVIPLRGHPATYLLGGPAIAALTCVLLIAWRRWDNVSARVLRPVVGLGVISYAVYLWDYPIALWLRPSAGWAAGPLAIALAVGVALISWRFVESPVLRRGGKARRPAATRTATADAT